MLFPVFLLTKPILNVYKIFIHAFVVIFHHLYIVIFDLFGYNVGNLRCG